MPPNPKPRLDALRRRVVGTDLEDGEQARDLCDADREALDEYARRLALAPEDRSYYRQLKLLRRCVRMAEHVGPLVETLDDRAAAERVIEWLNDEYYPEDVNDPDPGKSIETHQDYRVALKGFGRVMSDENGDDPPDSMTWISSGLPSNYDRMPATTEVLDREDDVIPMIEACSEYRDQALIAVAFESGMRSGELEDLTVGAITDSKYGIEVSIHGKTGRRSIYLIWSVPYLKRWLDEHPEYPDGNSDAPMWVSTSDYEPITYQAFLQIFKRAGRRADVEKPVTPTAFRKANAGWLAQQPDASAQFIEDQQGRVRGSEHVARYIARFGDEAEKIAARMHGVNVNEEDELVETGPIECPRCQRETPRERPLCVHCSMALTPEAAKQADEHDEALFDSAMEASATGEEDLATDLAVVRKIVSSNPELRAAILDAGASGDADAD